MLPRLSSWDELQINNMEVETELFIGPPERSKKKP